jgi:hypothetical protein
MAGIAELGGRAAKDGTLLDQGGLLPTATGALVRGRQGHRQRPLHRSQGGDRRLRDVAGARTHGRDLAGTSRDR